MQISVTYSQLENFSAIKESIKVNSMNFKELGFGKELVKGLEKEKITQPTQVQEMVAKSILDKKNMIIQSETGSGKTLAYLAPFFERMQPIEKGMKILILVPTHELAMQVHRQVERLAKNSGLAIQSTPIVGNVNIKRQIEYLREKPQIIIGTTGRILELIKKKKISAHTMETIVIDEADKLLDKNNQTEVKAVIKCCMRDVQILMFSATMPKVIIDEAQKISKDPEIIKTTKKMKIPVNIEHIFVVVERRDKLDTLRKLATSLNPKKAMVFINKVSEIEEANSKLKHHHYQAEYIHGTNKKEERKKVIQAFSKGQLQFLLATDIAARGLHFEAVNAVFHITIPENPLDYLHRAGRTGRGNAKGISISIVTKVELPLLKNIEKEFGIVMVQKKLKEGKLID